MSRVTTPPKCAKCGSKKIGHEILSMGGRYGGAMGRGYRFDVYICEECGYSEFFFKKPDAWSEIV